METDVQAPTLPGAILRIFRKYGTRAGEVLPLGRLQMIAERRGLSAEDVARGVTEGEALGWFMPARCGSIRLTETGFRRVLELDGKTDSSKRRQPSHQGWAGAA